MVDSQRVLCCGARTWTLVIGWIQIVLCVIPLGFFIGMLIWFLKTVNSDLPQSEEGENQEDQEHIARIAEQYTLIITVTCIAIAISVFGLIAGIILILGVKHKSPAKLQTWIIIEAIFVLLSFIEVGIKLWFGGPAIIMFIEPFVSISTSIFFIWVVNIYRHEVLNAGAGEVSYRFVSKA